MKRLIAVAMIGLTMAQPVFASSYVPFHRINEGVSNEQDIKQRTKDKNSRVTKNKTLPKVTVTVMKHTKIINGKKYTFWVKKHTPSYQKNTDAK